VPVRGGRVKDLHGVRYHIGAAPSTPPACRVETRAAPNTGQEAERAREVRSEPPEECHQRPVLADSRYDSQTVSKFINAMMYQGKKATAERIFYGAMDLVESRTITSPA